MRAPWLFIACFMAGFGLWTNPWAAVSAGAGTALLLCWYVDLRLGPLVRAAERAAKAFALGENTCVPELQEMARLAFLRRKL